MHPTALAPLERTPPPAAPWGMLAAIDLHDGDRERLADPDCIRRCVPAPPSACAPMAR